jgi:hypothetical protein
MAAAETRMADLQGSLAAALGARRDLSPTLREGRWGIGTVRPSAKDNFPEWDEPVT